LLAPDEEVRARAFTPPSLRACVTHHSRSCFLGPHAHRAFARARACMPAPRVRVHWLAR
jgi:hypothetical protein